jgi:hypothetical protein
LCHSFRSDIVEQLRKAKCNGMGEVNRRKMVFPKKENPVQTLLVSKKEKQ